MKKILAILMTIFLLAGVLCISAFAWYDDPWDDGPALNISGLTADGDLVSLDTNLYFEYGFEYWDYAMELAISETGEGQKFDRIVVDLLTDWNADEYGCFTGDFLNGPGFDGDTICIDDDARITLNLNGHTINRGLTEKTRQGSVIWIEENADVIINDGTITGGFSSWEGGGIQIGEDANVTLNNVHIVGNRVYNDDGAGIFMEEGSTLTMNGGSFENNETSGNGKTSYYGGAIGINEATATFQDVLFKNNRNVSLGSAIYADDSEVTITGCTFDGNGGGTSAIYGYDSVITVKNSTFTNNGGSALFELNFTDLIMDASAFHNNDHYYMILPNLAATVQITNSEFTDNTAGIMYVGWFAFMGDNFFKNCTFNNNQKSGSYNNAPIGTFSGDFDDVVFYDCGFGDSSLEYAEDMTIEYSYISEEDAVIGVTLLHKDGTKTVSSYKIFDYGWNLAIEAAKTNTYERVIIDLYADWNAKDGQFTEAFVNGAGFNWDAIYFPANVQVTLNMNGHTIDRGLTTDEKNGEVMYVDAKADVIINNGTIKGGYSNNGAGGIHINDGARVELNSVSITGNRVDYDDGAGIAVYGGATLIMNGCTVSDNAIINSFSSGWSFYGGGIFVEDSTAILTDVTFRNNGGSLTPSRDKLYGAAICGKNSTVTLKDCTVEENGIPTEEDRDPVDAIISVIGGTMELENTNLIGNGVKNAYVRESRVYYNALIDISAAKFTMTGGKVTGNNQVYLFDLNGTANVTGVDFTGNESLVMYGNGDPSKSSTFTNCQFSAGSTYKVGDREFNYDFELDLTDAGITFAVCDMGDTTFANRNAFKFVDGNGVENGAGSLFGVGSFTVILSILALAVSVAGMGVTLSLKKKLTPAAATVSGEAVGEE